MKVVEHIRELRDQIKEWKRQGLSIGFVPTMGYLHEGHASLIHEARKENDKVVVSIFVNPTQFGENEDLDCYPRDLEHDSAICKREGTDLIFHPRADEMYAHPDTMIIKAPANAAGLCGSSRPGHFDGVCTVITKLFNMVTPDRAYFGKKDAQQLAVIKTLVANFNFDVEVIGCPIFREEDGLAMSSRNVYLTDEQRIAAPVLKKSLNEAEQMLENGERSASVIRNHILNTIAQEKLATLDYAEIVDAVTFKPVETIENDIVIALAVHFGKTRLIDNLSWTQEK